MSPDLRKKIARILIEIDLEMYTTLAVKLRVPKPEDYMDSIRRYMFALFHVLGLEKELSEWTGIEERIVREVTSKAYRDVEKELFEKR